MRFYYRAHRGSIAMLHIYDPGLRQPVLWHCDREAHYCGQSVPKSVIKFIKIIIVKVTAVVALLRVTFLLSVGRSGGQVQKRSNRVGAKRGSESARIQTD